MTTKQILKLLKESGKPVVLSHLYRLFRKLDIQPLGSSRPQIYPANTAQRLLTHLGVAPDQPKATHPETAARPTTTAALSLLFHR